MKKTLEKILKVAVPVAAGVAMVAGLEASGISEFMMKLEYDIANVYVNNFGDLYTVWKDLAASPAARIFFDATSALAAGYTAHIGLNKKLNPKV